MNKNKNDTRSPHIDPFCWVNIGADRSDDRKPVVWDDKKIADVRRISSYTEDDKRNSSKRADEYNAKSKLELKESIEREKRYCYNGMSYNDLEP